VFNAGLDQSQHVTSTVATLDNTPANIFVPVPWQQMANGNIPHLYQTLLVFPIK
jgi:hypothetical protein